MKPSPRARPARSPRRLRRRYRASSRKKRGYAVEPTQPSVKGSEKAGVDPGAAQSPCPVIQFQSDEVDDDKAADFEGQEGEPQEGVEPQARLCPEGDEYAQAVDEHHQPGKERGVLQPVINEGVKPPVGPLSEREIGGVIV